MLIIDDEQLVRRTLRRILERLGHDVSEAADGAAGYQVYAGDPRDVVICDMMMPVLDGLATLRQLREAFPRVRFIAMSGGARTSTGSFLDVAAQMGASATLSKPFSKATVLDALASVLADALTAPPCHLEDA
ncbi:MAG TPA: response regulator [Kofleriaceae bacterium]|nr:response regulator [Kofleriaceae bacterium]